MLERLSARCWPIYYSKECKEKKYVNLSYFLILKLLGKKPCSEEVRFQSI